MEVAGLAQVPRAATIAVAGPVTDGQARLTNRDWVISEDALRRFGCGAALLINDFIALAFAVETGCEYFDLGGHPTPGLRDFKTRWGVLRFVQHTFQWSPWALLQRARGLASRLG